MKTLLTASAAARLTRDVIEKLLGEGRWRETVPADV